MPLIQSPSDLAASGILDHINRLQGCYESAAGHLNAITGHILGLGNNDLATFGNKLGPQEMAQLTTLHGLQGDGVNQLVEGVNAVLASIGQPQSNASVDVRPLPEKLAAQYREIVFDGAAFSVVDLPQPEPAPES